jgi:hypothetical protein
MLPLPHHTTRTAIASLPRSGEIFIFLKLKITRANTCEKSPAGAGALS